MSWSTTPPAPIVKPGWTTDPTIHIPSGNQQWEVRIEERLRGLLQPASAAMVGEVRQHGDLAVQLKHALFAGTGAQSQHGDLATLLQPASFVGTNITLGQFDAHLQPARAALTGGQQYAGAMAAALRAPTLAASGQKIYTGTIAAALQDASAALTGAQGIPGTLAAQLKTALAAANGGQTITGQLATALRNALFAGSAQHIYTGSMATALRNATFAGTGSSKNLVVFDNATDGGAGATTTRSFAHVNTGNAIVVVFTNTTGAGGTCTYGGVNIPRVYGPVSGGSVFPYTSYTSMFALVSNSLPQGSNTVSVVNGSNACAAAAVTFKNAGSIGTVSADTASGNINKSVSNGEGSAAVYGSGAGSNNFGTLSPNEFQNRGFVAFSTWASVAAWAVDTGSGITFSGSHSSTKAGALVPILPA